MVGCVKGSEMSGGMEMIERHELQGRVEGMDGTGDGIMFSHEMSGRSVERGAYGRS